MILIDKDGSFVYEFADEIVSKFSYDMNAVQIEVQFEGYYENGEYNESPCSLFIENWKQAKSKLHGEEQYDSLDIHLGIFSMILSLECSPEKTALSINTLDDRYIELVFEQVTVRVEKHE